VLLLYGQYDAFDRTFDSACSKTMSEAIRFIIVKRVLGLQPDRHKERDAWEVRRSRVGFVPKSARICARVSPRICNHTFLTGTPTVPHGPRRPPLLSQGEMLESAWVHEVVGKRNDQLG